MKFTVFGSKGFIGDHLVHFLKKNGHEVFEPARNFVPNPNEELGNVIYAIGLTADFRTRIFDTVEAHVCYLSSILKKAKFNSFVYLSSTRVYLNGNETSEKNSLSVNPNNFDDLYNLSKLMGESLCLAQKNKNIKIARLSNVLGNDQDSENFVFALINSAKKNKHIELLSAPGSEKDYINIEDAIELICKISTQGKNSIYNIASGSNLSNKEIIDIIIHAFPCTVKVKEDAKSFIFKPIDISTIKEEFGYSSKNNLINQLIEKTKI